MLFGVCFCVVFIFTEVYRRIALRSQIIDIPNQRSSHHLPTVRGGGFVFGMVWMLSSAIAIAPELPGLLMSVLVPGFLLLVVSFWDDLISLNPLLRLTVHIAVVATGLVGLSISSGLSLPYYFWFGLLFCGVWSINLYNFMDGIDGLAAAQAIFLFVVGGMYLSYVGVIPLANASYLLAACVAGFWVWNRPPARIFMGDCGSAVLGFWVFMIPILALLNHGVSMIPWLMLYAGFTVDATLTLLRRMLRGERFYLPHRQHAYQRLQVAGWSHAGILGLFFVSYLLTTASVLIAVAFPSVSWALLGVIYGYWIISYFWVETLAPLQGSR